VNNPLLASLRWPLIAVSVVGAMVLSSPAHAEGPSAAELSDQAYAMYEKGQFADAVALYRKAYEVSVDARILFNVAQIYDKKVQDRELAIEFYRRYLKSTTAEPELVKKSTERIQVLLAQSAPATTAATSAAPASAPAPAPSPPPPPPASRSVVGPVVGFSAAAGLGVASLLVGLSARSKAADARDSRFVGASTGPSSQAARDDLDGAKTQAIVADVLGLGALATAGVTLYFTLRASPAPVTASFSRDRFLLGGSF
jgi:tetratricopeptide (TPR) repeat protein